MVEIRVRDEGSGFCPDRVPDPTDPERLSLPCGRGIMLMRAYMNLVEFCCDGQEVYMVKKNPKRTADADGPPDNSSARGHASADTGGGQAANALPTDAPPTNFQPTGTQPLDRQPSASRPTAAPRKAANPKQITSRLTVHFSGHVQGVGFRYTARQVAERFAVTGYVRNLGDGRVEMVTEGEPDEGHACLQAVQEAMGTYIRETKTAESPGTGEFSSFGISH
jgi:acylphosphatase